MRPTLAAIAALLALSACGGATVYFAEGVDIATRDADAARCALSAEAAFPVRSVIRYTPRRFVPGRQFCDASGNCVLEGARWVGGDPYTVDVNASARQTAARGCMADLGYARISLPACEPGSAVRVSTVMPNLTGGTCLYRTGPGTAESSALVVNQAD